MYIVGLISFFEGKIMCSHGAGKKNCPKWAVCILPECILVKCILLLQTVGYMQLVIRLKFYSILRHSVPR